MDITLPLEGSDGGFRLAGATPEASRMLDPVAWEAVVERAAGSGVGRADVRGGSIRLLGRRQDRQAYDLTVSAGR